MPQKNVGPAPFDPEKWSDRRRPWDVTDGKPWEVGSRYETRSLSLDVIPKTIHQGLALEHGCRRDIVKLLLLEARESKIDFQDQEVLAWAERNASGQPLSSSLEYDIENGEELASNKAKKENLEATAPSTQIGVPAKKGRSKTRQSTLKGIRSSWISAIRSQSGSNAKGQKEVQRREANQAEEGQANVQAERIRQAALNSQAQSSRLPTNKLADGLWLLEMLAIADSDYGPPDERGVRRLICDDSSSDLHYY